MPISQKEFISQYQAAQVQAGKKPESLEEIGARYKGFLRADDLLTGPGETAVLCERDLDGAYRISYGRPASLQAALG